VKFLYALAGIGFAAEQVAARINGDRMYPVEFARVLPLPAEGSDLLAVAA
jgi:hypothetical protein